MQKAPTPTSRAKSGSKSPILTHEKHVKPKSRIRKNLMIDYAAEYSTKLVGLKVAQNKSKHYYQTKNEQKFDDFTQNESNFGKRNRRFISKNNSQDVVIQPIGLRHGLMTSRAGHVPYLDSMVIQGSHPQPVDTSDVYQLSTRNAKFNHPIKAFKGSHDHGQVKSRRSEKGIVLSRLIFNHIDHHAKQAKKRCKMVKERLKSAHVQSNKKSPGNLTCRFKTPMTQLLAPSDLSNDCLYEKSHMMRPRNGQMTERNHKKSRDLQLEVELSKNELMPMARTSRGSLCMNSRKSSVTSSQPETYNYPITSQSRYKPVSQSQTRSGCKKCKNCGLKRKAKTQWNQGNLRKIGGSKRSVDSLSQASRDSTPHVCMRNNFIKGGKMVHSQSNSKLHTPKMINKPPPIDFYSKLELSSPKQDEKPDG